VAFVAIVNGSLLERAKVELYLILVPILAAVIYPVVVGWTWGGGWLHQLGYVDFAGSSVVHLAGAVCTFTASLVLGPRAGRFENESPNVS
jgi:ammonium transporter, Amt family